MNKQSNKKQPKFNSMKAYKAAFPVAPLFMVAQLPFNTEETVKLNSPMIPIMDDLGNTRVCERNLRQMGVWKNALGENTSFLEIGCGSGYLLEHLYKKGKGTYSGIEPIKTEYDKSKKKLAPYIKTNNLLLQHGLLEKVAIKPNSIDIIYSYHVYEHLDNPLVMLECAKKWLKPNGKLIITCPNVEGFIPKRNLDKWRCAIPSHRWLPGLKILRHTLKRHDYRVLKAFSYGGFPIPRNPITSIVNEMLKIFNLGDVVCIMGQKK